MPSDSVNGHVNHQETKLQQQTWAGFHAKQQAIAKRLVAEKIKNARSAADADQLRLNAEKEVAAELASMQVVVNRAMCVGWNEEKDASHLLAEVKDALSRGYLVRFFLDVKDAAGIKNFKAKNKELFELLGLYDPQKFKAWIQRYYGNEDDKLLAENNPDHPLNWSDDEIKVRLAKAPYMGVGSPVIVLSEYEKEPAWKLAQTAFDSQLEMHKEKIKKGFSDIKKWIAKKYGTPDQVAVADKDPNHPYNWDDARILIHVIENAKNILSWHEPLTNRRKRFNIMLYGHQGVKFYDYLTQSADLMNYNRDNFIRLVPKYGPAELSVETPVISSENSPQASPELSHRVAVTHDEAQNIAAPLIQKGAAQTAAAPVVIAPIVAASAPAVSVSPAATPAMLSPAKQVVRSSADDPVPVPTPLSTTAALVVGMQNQVAKGKEKDAVVSSVPSIDVTEMLDAYGLGEIKWYVNAFVNAQIERWASQEKYITPKERQEWELKLHGFLHNLPFWTEGFIKDYTLKRALRKERQAQAFGIVPAHAALYKPTPVNPTVTVVKLNQAVSGELESAVRGLRPPTVRA